MESESSKNAKLNRLIAVIVAFTFLAVISVLWIRYPLQNSITVVNIMNVTNVTYNITNYNQTYLETGNEEFNGELLSRLENLTDRRNATITVNVECGCSGGSSRTTRTYNYHNDTVNNNTTVINEGDDEKGRREIIMYKEIWVKGELKHVKYKHLK